MTDEWYSYRDIRFQKAQIRWLLQNLPKLKEGEWPPCPWGGSSIDPDIKHTGSGRQSFQNPCEVWAEVKMRLDFLFKQNGIAAKDCNLMIAYYVDGVEDYRLANLSNLSLDYMERRISRALSYISGFRFWTNKTRESYQVFISHKKGG